MATVILLKNNDLNKNTNIGGNVNPDRYWYCVRDAQKIFLKPVIGDELYNKVCADFSGGTLSGAYKTLYDDYIKDYVVHQAASLYLAMGAYQVTNAGITKTSTENTETVDKDEIDYMVFHQRNLAKNYQNEMEKWLNNNKVDIPEYKGKCKNANNFYGWYISNNQKNYRGY
jgi:hypothetical protein